MQETIRRLCSIRGAEREIGKWFQNHAPMVDTTENEAPWTLVTHKSRTLLLSPPSSIITKNRHEDFISVDIHEKGLQETVPAAHSGYLKRM